MDMPLSGRVAIVTGSSRGIGRAIAIALAKDGARVVVNYQKRLDKAEEVARQIEEIGSQALVLRADVGSEADCRSLVDATAKEFGRIDILVNNAGIWEGSRVEEISSEALERIIDTNLKGAFYMTGHAVRLMKEQNWGRIVNVSSVIGVRGYPGDTMYASTKSALFGFTKSLAKELARWNITANVVIPGFIETDMAHLVGEDVREKVLKNIPLRRWGKPEEVADLVLFLVEKGDYITGQLLTVDGGYTI